MMIPTNNPSPVQNNDNIIFFLLSPYYFSSFHLLLFRVKGNFLFNFTLNAFRSFSFLVRIKGQLPFDVLSLAAMEDPGADVKNLHSLCFLAPECDDHRFYIQPYLIVHYVN